MRFEDADGGGVGGAGAAEDGVAAGGLDGAEDGGGGGGAEGGDELGGEGGGDAVDAWVGRMVLVFGGEGEWGRVPSSLWRVVETSSMQLSQLRGTAKVVWKGGIIVGVGRAAWMMGLWCGVCKTGPAIQGRLGSCNELWGWVGSPCCSFA